MNLPIGVYRPDDAREIHRRVLGPTATQPALDNTRDKTIHNLLYYALLLEDLTAATDPLTGYTQADIRVIRYVQPGDGVTLNMEASTTSTGIVQVTNRFESFSASAGDLLLVIRHGSEWSPINVASSGALRHAVVSSCYGNGYYTAYLSLDPQFSFPSTTGTGTGTTEGVGTGSGLFNECDMCSLVYGETEAGTGTAVLEGSVTCGSLSQPSRAAVTGDGSLIYVYDPRLLTLPGGAHVVVADMGDRIPDPGLDPGTGTGTGTGTATSNVILWIVQTGSYPLIGIPDRFYECCDNVVYLTRCDTYITEGYLCSGATSSCPVGTGTGTA